MISFSFSRLAVALSLAALTSTSFAAGLDRTGQDIKGFFNEGTYAEMDMVYISTDVSGYDNAGKSAGSSVSVGVTKSADEYAKGNPTGNITSDASFFVRYGAKADLSDNLTVGVFYDKPWGANVRFKNPSNFVSNTNQTNIISSADTNALKQNIIASATDVNPKIAIPGYDLQTSAHIDSETLTGLVGVKAAGFQVYGGPVMQKLTSEVHLRGNAYGPLSGYDAVTAHNTAYGWAAGLSYSIPEIALNAALTYRSKIEHKGMVSETLPALRNGTGNDLHVTSASNPALKLNFVNYVANATKTNPNNIRDTVGSSGVVTTPESVNLNFQTGLSEKYQLLGTLNARWVPWSKFKIVPPFYNAYSKTSYPEGLALLAYDKDQYSVDVGLGKRFSDSLAGSVIVGWDSGAGDPVSSIGPVNGMWSLGGGAKLNLTDEFSVVAGGKYMMLGDATAALPTGNVVGKYEDNTGYAAVIKLAYHDK